MKTVKSLTVLAVMVFAFSFASNAQGMKFVKIKTSANCEHCKDVIEKSLRSEAGVEEANLDLESKTVTVKYNEEETNYDNLVKSITKLGFNADDAKGCTGTNSGCCSNKAIKNTKSDCNKMKSDAKSGCCDKKVKST